MGSALFDPDAGTTAMAALAAIFDTGNRFVVLDANGDGKQDLMTRDGLGNFRLWLGDGSRLQPQLLDYVPAGLVAWSTGYSDALGWNSGNRFFAIDVNHDGKDDIVARDWLGNLSMFESSGSGFYWNTCSQATPWSDANGWSGANRFFIMDFDGDGFKDIVTRDSAGVLTVWRSVVGSCNRFTQLTTFNSDLSDAYGYNAGNRFAITDYDHNGTDDLLFRYQDGTFAAFLSTRTTFAWSGNLVSTGASDSQGWSNGSRLFLADVDGDGYKDIILRGTTGGFGVYVRGSGTGYTYAGTILSQFSDDASEVGLGFNRILVVDPVGGTGLKPLTLVVRPGGLEMQMFKSLGLGPFVRE